MHKNGVALRLAPEPAPASPSAQEDIRTAIGTAMADAVEAVGAGLADFDAGGHLPIQVEREAARLSPPWLKFS